jgi:hypothetical protein
MPTLQRVLISCRLLIGRCDKLYSRQKYRCFKNDVTHSSISLNQHFSRAIQHYFFQLLYLRHYQNFGSQANHIRRKFIKHHSRIEFFANSMNVITLLTVPPASRMMSFYTHFLASMTHSSVNCSSLRINKKRI